MRERQFEYGPFARGAYTALVCVLPLIFILWRGYTLHYIGLLLFLGIALRYILETTGLYHLLSGLGVVVQNRVDRKFLQQRRREIELKQRDEKYRRSHARDPRLPKNW